MAESITVMPQAATFFATSGLKIRSQLSSGTSGATALIFSGMMAMPTVPPR
ncbi:hypothetical protein D3C71_2088450 [compost metagenome]